MIFTSFNFFIFFAIIFVVYYFILNGKTKLQNWLLFLGSYVFYGIADWKMIGLLFSATVIIYFLAIFIEKSKEKTASLLSTIGIIVGVGLLVYYKYFNFFIESFSTLFNSIGLQSNFGTFNIILPLGISFFTFKLISYVLEVNSGNIKPSKDFVVFATYIAFFPTILSGPIDRPNTFIPQLQSKRSFNFNLACDGARQFLWGLFKKMVVADNIALVVNEIWEYQGTFSSSTLVLGAILYSFQLYADFSGYSDMAIGTGKLLGFNITKNFNYPFFATNIADFWRRWHISLTSWLTDYVFTPLSFTFRKWGKWGTIAAIIVNFAIVGLWHGANWTFLILGIYFGLLFIPLILSGSFYKNKKGNEHQSGFQNLYNFLKIVATFLLVTLGFVLFRADDISEAIVYVGNIFTSSIFSVPKTIGYTNVVMLLSFLFISLMLRYEWKNKDKEYGLEISHKKIFVQYAHYAVIIFLIYFFGSADTSTFIYFQF